VLPSSALFTVASFPFHYISLLITFAFGDFESVLQNFSLRLFQILEILDLAMTKYEEVNMTVTSSKHHSNPFLGRALKFFFLSSQNQVSLCVESILFVRQSLLQGN
jgi:hypothetical protein